MVTPSPTFTETSRKYSEASAEDRILQELVEAARRQAAQAGADTKVLSSETPALTPRKPRVLLGISGSVASIKALALVTQLSEFCEVRIVSTSAAQHFAGPLPKDIPVFVDKHEWGVWKQLRDPVLHIEVPYMCVDLCSHVSSCESGLISS